MFYSIESIYSEIKHLKNMRMYAISDNNNKEKLYKVILPES